MVSKYQYDQIIQGFLNLAARNPAFDKDFFSRIVEVNKDPNFLNYILERTEKYGFTFAKQLADLAKIDLELTKEIADIVVKKHEPLADEILDLARIDPASAKQLADFAKTDLVSAERRTSTYWSNVLTEENLKKWGIHGKLAEKITQLVKSNPKQVRGIVSIAALGEKSPSIVQELIDIAKADLPLAIYIADNAKIDLTWARQEIEDFWLNTLVTEENLQKKGLDKALVKEIIYIKKTNLDYAKQLTVLAEERSNHNWVKESANFYWNTDSLFFNDLKKTMKFDEALAKQLVAIAKTNPGKASDLVDFYSHNMLSEENLEKEGFDKQWVEVIAQLVKTDPVQAKNLIVDYRNRVAHKKEEREKKEKGISEARKQEIRLKRKEQEKLGFTTIAIADDARIVDFMANSLAYFGRNDSDQGYDTNKFTYGSRCENAVNALEQFKTQDPEKYKQVLKETLAWIALEEKAAMEFMQLTVEGKSPYRVSDDESAKRELNNYYENDLGKYQEVVNRGRVNFNSIYNKSTRERNEPVYPYQNGVRNSEDFIALSILHCNGPFKSTMTEAFEAAGVTIAGKFIAVEQKLEFSYEVTCVPYDAGARGIEAFVSEINASFKNPKINESIPEISHCVNGHFVTHSVHTFIAYLKKGTCRIKARYDKENLKVKKEDSPQFDDKEGKEMMPVHYKISDYGRQRK